MGKNLPHLHPMISLENGNPGCMKGIFHHFNHRKWHNVKKRLPHRRTKPPDVVLEDTNGVKTTNAGEESAKSSNHGRSSEPGSVHKSSMKSRLKALFSEEACRRKGRHHRSSSYPTRMPLDQVPSMHRTLSSDNRTTLNDSNSSHSLVSSLLDPALPRICGEPDNNGATCSLCAARESEVKIATFQESRIFFDALDLLNIRKELFMKVLQDPTTSLSHQIQNQRANTSRLGLTKSVSFPTSGSSGVGYDLSYPHICTNQNIIKQPLLIQDSAAAIGSPKDFKKQHHQHVNKLIMKRFKNLREKIRHAIKDTKKERQRIVMDGVLHKIPVGYPKIAKEEGDSQKNDVVAQNWCKYSPVDSILKNDQFFAEGNRRTHAIRRTASFSEVPLSRYNRLYELTYNTEQVSRSAVSRKKASMSRILSLPDMRSQSFSRLDRWTAVNSPEMLTMKLADDVDKYLVPLMEEEEDATTTSGENGFSLVEDSEPAPDVEPGEEEVDMITYEMETTPKQSYNDLLNQVGLKNRADFEYVKDVLEMSGFTGTEILGKWHSDGQPVDPMVFLEVEGCVLEVEGSNHLLLFDLINEVLLEIYGKTSSYWPKLLTNSCQVHPMPIGYHLLEDVWSNIKWYLQRGPEIDDPSLDDVVSHDLSKSHGWMNVQFEAECVGIELEDMVFDDLLDELVFS